MSTDIINDFRCLSLAAILDILTTLLVIYRLQSIGILNGVRRYSLLLFNTMIMLFCCVLMRVDLSFGAGLGLFALLAILRFRSEVIKVDELIGVLLLMGLGFIHSAYPEVMQIIEVLIIDLFLLSICLLIRPNSAIVKVKMKLDSLDKLHASRRKDLNDSLEKQFGMTMKTLEVLSVNLPDNHANILVSFRCNKPVTKPSIPSVPDIQRNSTAKRIILPNLSKIRE